MKFLKPDEYQPRQEKVFCLMKENILAVIPYAEVEHIGSSAIKGAFSKGDLDILVRVKLSEFEGALDAIHLLGFTKILGAGRVSSTHFELL